MKCNLKKITANFKNETLNESKIETQHDKEIFNKCNMKRKKKNNTYDEFQQSCLKENGSLKIRRQ